MTDGGGLLDNEEVEFLLENAPAPSGGPGLEPSTHTNLLVAQEVTMRGDLDQINLADIFQTLAMSKMEGFLRVSNPLEQRELYFQNGLVRCLIPNRTETLRLGQRLIRAGYLTADQLRSALLLQKKSHKQLGVILSENEFVSHEDIEDVLANQVQEDLFNLFTWRHGSFEFYKGKVTDEVTQKRLESTPEFEVNGVLLEVARRSDEWSLIIEDVSSLDEIFEHAVTELPGHLNDDHRVLVEAIDAKRNLRDLADITLLGLFECSRLTRELLNRGILRRIPVEAGIAVAREQLESGDVKRATMTVHALLERPDPMSPTLTVEVAETLSSCGEHKSAGELLVEAGRRTTDADEALRIARRAQGISKRSVPVLRFLIQRLEQLPRPEPQELIAPTLDLVECLMADGEYEDALTETERLDQLSADPGRIATLRARTLSKLGRTDEAVAALSEFADTLQANSDKDRLIQVYEQILKIDYRRRDVARALKTLHASKLARRSKLAALALLVLSLVALSYWQLDRFRMEERMSGLTADVEARIAAGDLSMATEMVNTAAITYGDSPHVEQMFAMLEQARREHSASESMRLEEARIERVNRAAEKIQVGALSEALDEYVGLTEFGIAWDEAVEIARLRLTHVQQEQAEQIRKLRLLVPEMPTLLQTESERARILKELENSFQDQHYRRVVGLLAARDDPRLRSILGDRGLASFVDVMEEARDFFADALAVKRAYVEANESHAIAKDLTPLFHDALDHERNHRFERARQAYRTLADRHPADDHLKVLFRNKHERFAMIVKFLGIVETATQRGDFQTAQGQLRALKSQFPEIPFDTLTRLPVAIESTPGGATVLIDGETAGRAPLRASYVPAQETHIRVELDKHYAEEITLTGDETGVVRSLLARKPDWQRVTTAAVDRAPVVDGRHRIFIADRAGTLTALSIEGAELWTLKSGDLSGLLTRPALVGLDKLVVASVDGKLRCVRREDGKTEWELDGFATAAAPVATDSVIVVAANQKLYGLDSESGTTMWIRTLAGKVDADLLTRGGTVYAVTTVGKLHAFRVGDGRLQWEARVGVGCVATPALSATYLAVAADDGSVTVLNPRTGATLWRTTRFASLTLSPAIHGERLFVAEDRELTVFDAGTGRVITRRRNDGSMRMHLSSGRGTVFVGDETGQILVLDPATVEPRFRLRGSAAALAPVVELVDGTLLAAYQDRTLRVYRRP